MPRIKKYFWAVIIGLITLLFAISCSDSNDGATDTSTHPSYPDIEVIEDAKDTSEDTVDAAQPDTYEKDCITCSYYFCPPLNAIWQKEICIDTCTDPPSVVLESECVEKLECDPTNYLIEKDIPCVTEEGYPGLKDKTCDKGIIQYTKCKTECKEEVCNLVDDDCDGEIDEGVKNACGECGDVPEETCDYIDNDCDGVIDNGVANACGGCGKEPEEICNGIDDDCDGDIDEFQLNACGGCGIVPQEICNGLDDDCDGKVDEDLIDKCSTPCEENLSYCINGNWYCTAKKPQEEICNGQDDDCDGDVDEELNCLCTKKDVGTLYPCQESPLVCGAGYRTCECVDPNDPTCAEAQMTACLAKCHWLPETLKPGEICDKYLGEIKPEECNNHDDNCNQQVDEGLVAGCYSGPPQTMYVGICVPGEMTCFQGKWGHYDDLGNFMPKMCLNEVLPEPEDICNGTDTNCDGKIDEDKELEPTDILFIIDLSGSMDAEINAVMLALNKFATHYSDSDVIKWGLVFTASAKGWAQEQVVLQTDLVDFDTFMNIFQTAGYSTQGGDEQNYDAIYLAISNLVGAAQLPYPLEDFEWTGWATEESQPPAAEWSLSWRDDAKHVIILFSDEEGQSYLDPKITEEVLVDMINAADELSIYAFTEEVLLELNMANNYVALTEAGIGGKAYKLTTDALEMYNHLLQILDETACSGNKKP